jgi:hypothetical protein
MAAAPFDFDFRNNPAAFVDNLYPPASNLSAPNIALGYLNSIGKNDASSLQNAIQATENAGNARQQEGLRRMEQGQRDLAAQAQRQQEQKYAEEGNARNMLLAKSNEIAGQINDVYKNYDYTQNPRKYSNALNELTRQKAEIDAQLEQATEAVRSNPMHQGTTLVNPVTAAQKPITSMTEEMEGELNAASSFLGEEFADMSEKELDKTTPDKLYEKLKSNIPDLQMSRDEFNSIYKDYYEHYKNPFNRASETLKRKMSVSNEVQAHQIKQLENQVALAQALAGAANLDNAKAMMKSLGIKESSPFWNFGIENHGNAALRFLGAAAQKLQAQQHVAQEIPPEDAKAEDYQ